MFVWSVKCVGVYYGRYVIVEVDNQWYEGFIWQFQCLYQVIYDEGCVCYIIGVFKEGEEQVYYFDLWYQWQDGIDFVVKILCQEDG